MNTPPIVLAISGLDPSGGAGLAADIQSISALGCHCAPVAAALTVQDTRDVIELVPVDANLVIAQARAVLEDLPVAAIKIGLLGSMAAIEAVHTLLRDYPNLPVVLDPILAAGGGSELTDSASIDCLRSQLLPLTTLLTPNTLEAQRLAPEADSLDACAMALLDSGCDYVLLTGTHAATAQVENRLYGDLRCIEQFSWPRLEPSYHGSGCTLAASLAALIAQGESIVAAARSAQEYTQRTLRAAFRPGMGQWIPQRQPWGGEG